MTPKRILARRVVVTLASLLILTSVVSATPDKKEKQIGRFLHGKVFDRNDNPLVDAVVYLTNTRTRSVKSYIVGPDGSYSFPGLLTTVDYELYAQYKGKKSDTKSVSQFDDRTDVYIVLRVDTP